MVRGGKRTGSGGKFKWNLGKTKVIRVPEAIADQVLALAGELDQSGYIDHVTSSKVVDLSGISVSTINGNSYIFLKDLLFMGYEIKPDKLAEKIISEAYKNQLSRGK
jgi:hypothetical protein